MNTRSNVGQRRGEEVVRGNKDPPQAPAAEIEMPINQVGLTDGEVRKTLVQMSQAIILEAQAMTTHIETSCSQKEPTCQHHGL